MRLCVVRGIGIFSLAHFFYCGAVQTRQHIPAQTHLAIVQAHWRETCHDRMASSCPEGKGQSLLGISYDQAFMKFNGDKKNYYPELAFKLSALGAPASEIRGGIELEVAPQIRYNFFNAFLFWLSPAWVYNPRTAGHEQYLATKVGLTVVANSDVKAGEEPFLPRVAYSFEAKLGTTRVQGAEPLPGWSWQLGVGFGW